MIGSSIDSFDSQLPTGLDVLKLYCSEWNSTGANSDKITWVVDSIKKIWKEADIPIRDTTSIRLKVKNLVDKFKTILRTRRKSTVAQVKKEDAFIENNRLLFDIANQRSRVELCHVKRMFLNDQKNSRLQRISDMHSCGNERIDVSNDSDSGMSDSEDDHAVDDDTTCENDIGCESDNDYSPSSSDYDESPPKKKLKPSTILSLDNAGLSFRQMQQVSRAFIAEFGEKPSDYCLGVSTFHAHSTKNRKETATRMYEEMKNRSSKLVLLFDTKTYRQLNAAHLPRKKRLAIVAFNERTHYGIGSNT